MRIISVFLLALLASCNNNAIKEHIGELPVLAGSESVTLNLKDFEIRLPDLLVVKDKVYDNSQAIINLQNQKEYTLLYWSQRDSTLFKAVNDPAGDQVCIFTKHKELLLPYHRNQESGVTNVYAFAYFPLGVISTKTIRAFHIKRSSKLPIQNWYWINWVEIQ